MVPLYAAFFFITGSLATALTLTVAALLLLSLVSTYALAKFLRCGTAGAILAAFGFTFSGYTFGQWGHVQLASLGLIPLSLLFLFRTLDRPRLRDGAAFGLTSAALAMCSLYYGAIYAIVVVIIIGGWAARRWRDATRRLLVSLGVGAALAIALLAPLLPAFVGSKQALHTTRRLVPSWDLTLTDLIRPPSHSVLYGSIARSLPVASAERQTFPGFLLYLLAAIGLVAVVVITRRAARQPRDGNDEYAPADDRNLFLVLLVISGVVALLVAGGSRILGVPGPFVFLHAHVPGFDGIRVPARFVVIWLLAISLLAGRGMQRLTGNSRKPFARLLLIALPSLVLVENLNSVPYVKLPLAPMRTGVYHLLASKPAGAAIELPIAKPGTHDWDTVEPLRMLYSTADWHPRINGYSGYFPPGYAATAAVEKQFPSKGALALLHRLGVRWVILHTQAHTGPAGYSFAAAAAMLPGLPAGTPVERAPDGLLIDLG